MNFIKHYSKLALLAAVIMLAATSCNEKQTAEAPKANGGAALENLKIRYIDEDSIMANYNLAKDINEAMLRRQNQFDAAQKQRGNEISKFGNAMQQKYQNNQYLTEEAFNADQAKLQKMQADAQLLDSIDKFMKDYAKKKGFDMVLRKSATLYIDEKYDVTNEVIEGLNKRYNKVGGKVAPAPAKAEPAKSNAPTVSAEKPATPGKIDLKK